MKFFKNAELIIIIKRFAKHNIKPLLPIFLLGIFLMIVVALLTSSYAYLIKIVLDGIFISKNKQLLIILPFILMVITFLKNAALYLQIITMSFFSSKITISLQKQIFNGIVNLDLKKFNTMHTGNMMAMITSSITAISNGLNTIFTILIRELLTVLLLVGIMIYNNPQLALLSMVGVPLIFFPIIKIAKRLKKLTNANLIGNQNMFATLDDSLKSIRLIKTYGTEEFEKNKFSNTINSLFQMQQKIIRTASLSGPLVECISIIGIALVIWYGGNNVINGVTTPGTFFAFFASMTIAYKPLKSISNLNVIIMHLVTASKQFFSIIDAKPEINEPENPVSMENFKGKIEFKNVEFYYEEKKKILQNVSFVINPKNKIAFVGPTGAGKSTIISLIMRLYDPISGTITLDGHDLKNYSLKDLKAKFAYVGQEVQLFDDTIINNLLYVNPNATKEQIIESTKLSNALEFIEKMPDKFETKIGQSGVNLSGGQKQRISIARAILKNAEIIILDEPTSALDAISEQLIKDSLNNFSQTKTVITIAHRLSTVINSDIIYVLEDGTITESGTHQDLINQNGHYAKLYKTQFSLS